MLLNNIFEGLIGLIGSTVGVGIFILIVILSIAFIKNLNYTEFWLLILVSVGSLTNDYGGGFLPEWFLVIVLIPFGWLLAEIIIKRWQGQNY